MFLSQCACLFVSTIIQKVAGDFHENLEEGLVAVVTSKKCIEMNELQLDMSKH